MKPMYILMNQNDEFILPRMPDRVIAATKWTDGELYDMFIGMGREFTSIRFRFGSLKEAQGLLKKLERIRKAIIKYHKRVAVKYPHLAEFYEDTIQHHQELKMRVVKVSYETC